MTTYRFGMKYEYDPTSLWRDIVVGERRTLVEVPRRLNASVGLDQDHSWFFGTDQDSWNSDVTYEGRSPFDTSPGPSRGRANTYDAAETTIALLARQSNLEELDRRIGPTTNGRTDVGCTPSGVRSLYRQAN